MFLRGITLSLAALLACGPLSAGAGAEESNMPSPEGSYSGPPLLRNVPGLRIIFGDFDPPDEKAGLRSGKNADFDESYYEPQPAPPPKAKKKATETPPKPSAASGTASTGEASPSATTKTASQPKAESATAKAAAGLSCEKAASIIAGYGFSDVAPARCAGKVYAFNAKRDGKSFAIKLDSASGQLSEVKKLP
jgi:hypothetical protein